MALADTLRGTLRSARRQDPFHLLWRMFTSVRVAIYLLGLVAFGALLGTVIPQIPIPMRGIAAAEAAWVEFQRGRFGPFTTLFYRLGLFNVFETYWFNGLLVLVLVAVAVCTANRFTPTWRSITRPQLRVPDAYFTRARHRARREGAVAPEALITELRRRRYLVRRVVGADVVYLYADRYRWAQLATFVSHLSLILLLAGGLVTRLFGYDRQLYIAEGRTAPVFSVVHPRQMQIEVKKFVENRDDQGRITDFRTSVVLYSRGVAVKEGDITVNGPLKWGGFVFHQVARQVNGAELEVRDRSTGQLLYKEVLDLFQGAPAPRLSIRDAEDRVVFDERLVLTLFGERGPAGGAAALVPLPTEGRSLVVALRPSGRTWRMEIVELGGSVPRMLANLQEGESAEAGGLTFTFAALANAAWAQVSGIPGVRDGAVVMMTTPGRAGLLSAVDGSATLDAGRDDTPSLYITGPITWEPAVAGQGLVALPVGTPVEVGDYQYTFIGRRAFTGLVARRDPGTGFIWVGVTLFIAAVCVTFYFPRRRLWAKVGSDVTLLAGVADRGSRYGEELQRLLDGLPAGRASAGEAAPLGGKIP